MEIAVAVALFVVAVALVVLTVLFPVDRFLLRAHKRKVPMEKAVFIDAPVDDPCLGVARAELVLLRGLKGDLPVKRCRRKLSFTLAPGHAHLQIQLYVFSKGGKKGNKFRLLDALTYLRDLPYANEDTISVVLPKKTGAVVLRAMALDQEQAPEAPKAVRVSPLMSILSALLYTLVFGSSAFLVYLGFVYLRYANSGLNYSIPRILYENLFVGTGLMISIAAIAVVFLMTMITLLAVHRTQKQKRILHG